MKHQRSSFDRSCSHTTSFNAGQIIPIYCEDVLPGDTVSMNTSSLVRLQTMLTPFFGNVYLDTYWFFVPNRLCWTHWKEFMGENTQSAWAPTVEYSVPRLLSPRTASDSSGVSKTFPKGTLADYFGFRVSTPLGVSDPACPIHLPVRAYCLIWNDFFRDQNLQDPVYVPTDDKSYYAVTADDFSSLTPFNSAMYGGWPLPAAKYHDYFTSCLPSPQKGPAVSVPASLGSMPVYPATYHGKLYPNENIPGSSVGLMGNFIGVGSDSIKNGVIFANYQSGKTSSLFWNHDGSDTSVGGFPSADDYPAAPAGYQVSAFSPSNLWAIPSRESSVGISVNDLRLAVVTQMYYEALARGGSRYEEQIQQFFGVTNPDSRVQHPEYLGGRRMQINVHEVTNTAQSEKDFLGDVGAQSVTAGSNSDFTKSFTEHGWLLGLAVVRYEHNYHQGIARKWTRKNKFDYYNPVFANIGEQPVFDYELFCNSDTKAGSVFGYQEAWASYRYSPSMVSGEIRPSESLGYWTTADNYASKPTLSSGWIAEDAANLDRVLAVKSTVANQVFGDFYFNCTWTRPMPMFSVPGAIGQF